MFSGYGPRGTRSIGPFTLVILDGTDIQKAYAERMEHLAIAKV